MSDTETAVEQPVAAGTVATAPPPAAAAPAPAPAGLASQYEQDLAHLMNHLGDLKAFLARFPHTVEGKIGEIVAYLKANL